MTLFGFGKKNASRSHRCHDDDCSIDSPAITIRVDGQCEPLFRTYAGSPKPLRIKLIIAESKWGADATTASLMRSSFISVSQQDSDEVASQLLSAER